MSNLKNEINEILCAEFEIDSSKINDEANVFTDLGLDSLDAADMLVLLEEKIGKKINGEDFMQVRTLGDIYKIVDKIVQEK